MSTETTNKKIEIDDGTTFGRVYTDKAVDELLKNRNLLEINGSSFTGDIKLDSTNLIKLDDNNYLVGITTHHTQDEFGNYKKIFALKPEYGADGVSTGNLEKYWLIQDTNDNSRTVQSFKILLKYYKHSIQLSYKASDTDKATINLNYYSMSPDRFTTIKSFYDALHPDSEKILCNGIITKEGKHLIATAVYTTTKFYSSIFGWAFLIDYINPSDGTEGHTAINDNFSVSDRVAAVD